MSATTYYPQTALEGFAAALASKLRISIVCAAGQPRTDGRTVYLPRISTMLDSDGFAALCGVAIHEAAHVYFGTCDQMRAYAVDALHAACFNAVVDVADETRIEQVVPSAPRLLRTSNRSSDERICASGAIDNSDPVWAILAAGILMVRRGGHSGVYQHVRHGHKYLREMMAAYRILRSCRARRTRKTPGPRRTKAEWDRLRRAADELVTLLRPVGDASGAPQIQFGPVAADADGDAARGLDPAKIDPSAKVAGYSDGAAVADGSASGSPGGSGAGTGGSGDSSKPREPMDGALYAALRPCLMGVAERLARHDEADGLDGGYLSGPRLGRNIETAGIDGRCFARRNAEGERLHAAVLLDCSGSMYHILPQVAAVAQAFAESLARVAESVSLAEFGSDVRPVGGYRDAEDRGGTRTDMALEWADRALSGKSGRKVCVVVTDGEPGCVEATQRATGLLGSHGVRVIGIAYACGAGSIASSMPGALVVEARDPNTLAVQLSRIAKQVGAAA